MSELKVEPIEKYGLSAKSKPKSQFATIGVVGCGYTGQQITLMASIKGIEVVFLEKSQEKVNQSLEQISQYLDCQINRWGMTDSDKRGVLSRIKGTVDYKSFSNCDLVIESILSQKLEDCIEVRKEVFKNIEANVSQNAIIASNSTVLFITELASVLKNKERCVGMHFFSMSSDETIIEIAKGVHTTDAVYEDIYRFAQMIGKTAIPVEESPGLVTARLFVSFLSEACDILMEGVSDVENINIAMRQGIGMHIGPFEMADKIGLDCLIRWMNSLYNEFGYVKYKPSPILNRLVRAGYWGCKTGRGFYEYDEQGHKAGLNSVMFKINN